MLVLQNVYLSKCIIAEPAVQSIRKVVIQYIKSQNKNQVVVVVVLLWTYQIHSLKNMIILSQIYLGTSRVTQYHKSSRWIATLLRRE